MIRIAVDCFGSDHAPDAQVQGSLAALRRFPDLALVLCGDETILKARLEGKEYDPARLTLLHAPQVIDCHDKPTDAIRLKRESSMMRAIRLLREDDTVTGMVSAGSTGALVAAALLRVVRLRGVLRPPFCPILPTMKGGIVGICDTGATVDITADYLVQYAVMGSLYLQRVYGIESPRVALLNIGTEAEKGDALRKEAYGKLQTTPGICFVGNMESRDLLSGKYDLVVCDGFSGNVLIKATEGACLEMLHRLQRDISSRWMYKLGALLQLRMFKEEKQFMNYQNYGGSILLGTAKIVVKGHGSGKALAMEKCVEQAYRTQLGALSEATEAALAALETPRS